MTPPRKADAAPAAGRDTADAPTHATHEHSSAARKPSSISRALSLKARRLRTPLTFLLAFAALLLLHLTLLGLPYYWDEAGYFIPAARDIYADGQFVPHTTLSNAHPPLVMAYLAVAWKLFGFRIEVARTAMLAVAALALAAVYALGARVANHR